MDSGFESRLLYVSEALWIGAFRCEVWHSDFESLGQIRTRHALVFPRTSVYIHQEGHEAVLMDPNRVTLYNPSQPYRRLPHSQKGDRCDFFYFEPHPVLEALSQHDPAAVERPDRIFRIPSTACDARTYFLQRMLVEYLLSSPNPDRLFVEETGMEILRRVATRAALEQSELLAPPAHVRNPVTRRVHRELALSAQDLINRRFDERLNLAQIAASLYVSPFHLARVFRRETGITLHAYQEQLRLRAGLERIVPGSDLAATAISLGFSHHSHFTQSMHRNFGQTPSHLSRALFEQ